MPHTLSNIKWFRMVNTLDQVWLYRLQLCELLLNTVIEDSKSISELEESYVQNALAQTG